MKQIFILFFIKTLLLIEAQRQMLRFYCSSEVRWDIKTTKYTITRTKAPPPSNFSAFVCLRREGRESAMEQGHSPSFEQTNDLTTLSVFDDDILNAAIKQRYRSDIIYVTASDLFCFSVNHHSCGNPMSCSLCTLYLRDTRHTLETFCLP